MNQPRAFESLPEIALQQRTFEGVRALLFYFGHFMDFTPDLSAESYRQVQKDIRSEGDARFREAVASYQSFGLNVKTSQPLKRDADFGFFTQSSLTARFCLCADRTESFDVLRHNYGGGQPKFVGGPVAVWTDMQLGAANPGLYVKAANWWSEVCGIEFKAVGSKGEADIYAHAKPIDGASGTLGWSYSCVNNQKVRSAGGNRQIEQRYDSDDKRLFSDEDSAVEVINHEDGHAVHFDGHTNDPNDIMFPSFTRPKRRHGQNEIRYMQQAYGKPKQAPEPEPPDTPDTGEWVKIRAFVERDVWVPKSTT